MKCASCQHENESADKFCSECGSPLVGKCASCGAALKAGAKFCSECSSSTEPTPPRSTNEPPTRRVADYTPKHLADKILQSKSALEGERKQVTVLFADIQGSMQLATQLDPEQWHQLLERYFAILAAAVHRFEGTVNQYTGDGIMALFGAPIAHEDHAQRACYAALQGRDHLRAFADDLRVTQGLNFCFRIGLNSGDVVVGKIGDDLRMDYTAQGATVGIAQRIEQLAAPGHVYLSGATERLVAGYFRLRVMGKADLKGLAEALPLFELEATGSARTRLDVAMTRGLSRFVGRTTEMQTLEAALAHAERGHGQVIGIVGEPGLGKSRLCFEFIEHCRRKKVPVFEAHCPAHGKNIPYLPILELFRNYFEIKTDDDAPQSRKKIAGTLILLDPTLSESLPVLFEFMGVGDASHPAPRIDAEAKQRQLYELLHRVVRAQDAQGQVSVTMIDDLHWVDAGSDGFVNQLVSAVAGKRSLIVLNFRPEYIAAFANRPHYQQLPLVPLGDAPLRELIADLIGHDRSVTELSTRIIEWTSGNPFYTEELIKALIEAGDLVGQPGHYRLMTTLARLVVPANVRAVLAARIDRLPEAAKRLLQTAAVIGKEFSGPLLEAVTELPAIEQAAALERLKAGDFVYERALYPVFEYAFKHPLTQEVAYQSQLQSRRAVVHGAVARALEAQAGDKLDEQAALLAHHCELAGEVLNAARWHKRAAEWAGLNDINAALYHWLRVRALVRSTGDDAESTALTMMACSRALTLGWRLGESAADWSTLFEEGCAAAERAGDLPALSMLNANWSALSGLTRGSADEFVRYSAAAVAIADQTTDAALRSGTRAFLTYAHWYRGDSREAESVAGDLIALAGDDPDLGTAVAGLSPLIAAYQTRSHIIGFTRDPVLGLQEARRVRQFALDRGYRDMASWLAVIEGEIMYASRRTDGIGSVAQEAMSLAKDRGAAMEIMASCTSCNALSIQGDWQSVLQVATDTLRRIRETRTMGLWEPLFFAHIANAHLELGHLPLGRVAAQAGVDFMRKSKSVFSPRSYALLAQAQLALTETVADIAGTLDEYEALLTRTGFHVYEGELHELRAHLAEREGQQAERAVALARAHACYTRFGMTAQAAWIESRQVQGTGVLRGW